MCAKVVANHFLSHVVCGNIMQCLALTLPVKMDTLPSDIPVFKRLSSTSTYSFSVLLLHSSVRTTNNSLKSTAGLKKSCAELQF